MTKPRVLVTESLADAAIAALDDGGADPDVRTDLDRDALLKAIGDYDAVIVRSATKIDADVIAAGSRLKVIGRAGVGVDNVDVGAATRRGIVVVNAPQGNIISNAEHTIGLLLALVRRIPQAHATLVGGRWDRSAFMGMELHDKTLGLLGLGRVGTLVAQKCHAFGMHVIARDPYLPPDRFARLGVEQVELDELLARSDVISVHVQRTPETTGMIGEAELERCKDGVFFVNTARGGIIDEDALARAIKAGKVGGAALDAFENEPVTSSPLFELDRVVVTPHLGGSTQEAQDKAGAMVAEQVLLALRGEFTPHAVNVDAGRELPEHLRGYLALARKLGRLASALAGEQTREIEVSYHGEVAEEDTRVLTLSALRGFLGPQVHEPVTFVNAPLIARDRGLDWGERRSASAEDFTDLIRVVAKRDGTDVSVAGTLTGRNDEERLVEIDGRSLEIALTPFMAFFRYEDRPGVVHKMSGPLAEHGINIEYMAIDKSHASDEPAIMALAVGSEIPADVFDEMKAAAGIASGRFVALDD